MTATASDFDRADFRAAYYREHAACPVCGGDSIEQTTAGVIGFFDEAGKFINGDQNRASCCCGWCGRVHDLKPLA